MRRRFHMGWFLPGLGLILLIAVWAYACGLHGGFLFDDFANLPALGASGPVDNAATFWRYITSGTADPTGRPLALLSFLLDARDWPAAARPFLRTNLILHLLNGVLLALLLRRLGRATACAPAQGDAWRTDLAAILGAGFWLLHPLFVSSTLYIVQREAMLPAFFTSLGLLLWIRGRTDMLNGRQLAGFIRVLLGLAGCTVLGMLGKANGVLLPALALVLEYTVLRHSPRTFAGPQPAEDKHALKLYRRCMLLLGWLPASLVGLYLLHAGYSGLVHGVPSIRSWTLGQRLLTEPRILMDYLSLLWLPRPFTAGLFNDSIHVSTSLWAPLTSLPALLAVLGMISGAIVFRRRWPACSAAVLFYFVGQSLESSSLPLELFYEHRNYLPAMLMFWPLALCLCGAPQRRPDKASATTRGFATTKLACALLVLAALGLMTHARASLWANQHDQALLWASLNPHSARAQAYAAQAEIQAGHPQRAVARLRPALAAATDQPQLALNLFAAECQTGRVDPQTIQASVHSLQTAINLGSLLTSWFERAIQQTRQPACPELSLATLAQFLHAVQSNNRLMQSDGRRQEALYLQGRIELARNDGDAALLDFNRALDQQVRISAALKQAALLGQSGHYRQGLAHLHYFDEHKQLQMTPASGMPQMHAWILARQAYWQNEMARLRQNLQDDLQNQDAP